jgi:hypothetical protein
MRGRCSAGARRGIARVPPWLPAIAHVIPFSFKSGQCSAPTNSTEGSFKLAASSITSRAVIGRKHHGTTDWRMRPFFGVYSPAFSAVAAFTAAVPAAVSVASADSLLRNERRESFCMGPVWQSGAAAKTPKRGQTRWAHRRAAGAGDATFVCRAACAMPFMAQQFTEL